MTTNNNDAIAKIANLVATNCLACGTPLTDAESVERGIGPVCSGKYYEVQHEVTETMVEAAVGHLAMANMRGLIPDDVFKAVADMTGDPRNFVNVITRYFAATQTKEILAAITPAYEAMGYKALADKLNKANLDVHIVEHGDANFVAFPYSRKAAGDFRAVKGARKGKGPKGSGYGRNTVWYYPESEEAHVLAILGHHFGGQPAFVVKEGEDSDRVTLDKVSWPELRNFRAPKAKAAPARRAVGQITIKKGFIEIKTPYNSGFVKDLKSEVSKASSWRDRRWNPKKRVWEVDAQHTDLVKDLVLRHYGAEPEVVKA